MTFILTIKVKMAMEFYYDSMPNVTIRFSIINILAEMFKRFSFPANSSHGMRWEH